MKTTNSLTRAIEQIMPTPARDLAILEGICRRYRAPSHRRRWAWVALPVAVGLVLVLALSDETFVQRGLLDHVLQQPASTSGFASGDPSSIKYPLDDLLSNLKTPNGFSFQGYNWDVKKDEILKNANFLPSELVTDRYSLNLPRSEVFIAVRKKVEFKVPGLVSDYTIYLFDVDDQSLRRGAYRFRYADQNTYNEACSKLKSYLEQQKIGEPYAGSLDDLSADYANGFLALWIGKDGSTLILTLTAVDNEYWIEIATQAAQS